MIYLSEQQMEDIGLRFIIDQLNTCTPYGDELAANLKPFFPNEKKKLCEELDNIGKIKDNYNGKDFANTFRILSQFKDIRPSIKKCLQSEYVLNDVELFELKNFLLNLEELDEVLVTVQKTIKLTEPLPKKMPKALVLLDPEETRLRTFYIPDSATNELLEIRTEKRRLEAAIVAADNEEQKRLLRDKRLIIVIAEEEQELIVRRKLTTGILSHAEDFFANTGAIGRFDLLLQKGRLAIENKTTRPVNSESQVLFDGVYNPYIAHLLKKNNREITPVSITLHKGTAILTGANMGGKSVVLKTLILNILLFQMGFYVFADKARLPMFDFVFLVSEDLESAEKGLSSFAAEIVRLKEITENLEQGFSFAALDEFARGTNPSEGAALARAVALYLNKKNAISILTTHYDNVSSPEFNNFQVMGLKNLNIDLFRKKLLPTGENSAALIAEFMDYRLQQTNGDSDPPKDAVNICKMLNFPDEILNILHK